MSTTSMTKTMALWKEYETIVKVIAFINIIFTFIVTTFVSLFVVILIVMPETIDEVMESNPDELEEEILEIMSKPDGIRFIIIALIWVFWLFTLVLSVALRYWTIKRDVRGLKFWLTIHILFAIASLPADFLWLSSRGVTMSHVMFLGIIDFYLFYSMYAVFRLVKSMRGPDGPGNHVVEFQSL